MVTPRIAPPPSSGNSNGSVTLVRAKAAPSTFAPALLALTDNSAKADANATARARSAIQPVEERREHALVDLRQLGHHGVAAGIVQLLLGVGVRDAHARQ